MKIKPTVFFIDFVSYVFSHKSIRNLGRFTVFTLAIMLIGLFFIDIASVEAQSIPKYSPYIGYELSRNYGGMWMHPCDGTWNPIPYLQSTLSCVYDYTGEHLAYLLRAAAYGGSDIEPMASTEAEHIFGEYISYLAKAEVKWPQQITMGEGFEDVLPWIDTIPVIIKWRVAHNVEGTGATITEICLKNDATYLYKGCTYGAYAAKYYTTSHGSWLGYLGKTYEDDEIPWEISQKTTISRDSWRYIRVYSRSGWLGEDPITDPLHIQSISEGAVDPFIEVDPDWEYAPYFQLVQPAGVDDPILMVVTRDWQYNDTDGDNYTSNKDCNDLNATINPGVAEDCADGIDNDCDGYIDTLDVDCGMCIDNDTDDVCDDIDNCPGVFSSQADVDADGLGNACDNCPYVSNSDQNDNDFDDVGDVCDNCPYVYNPGQENYDLDDLGNVCDNCPHDYNPDQSNLDGDVTGDVCDPDADGDGFKIWEGDCNDLNATIKPGVAEDCADGIDNNCDGYIDTLDFECMICTDNDGDGSYVYNNETCRIGNDCNDNDPTIIGVIDDTYINYDVTVCPGSYGIEDRDNNGVFIFNASNAILNCNGAPINGTNLGKGIYSNGFDNIAIRNCDIRDYYDGVVLFNVDDSSIENLTITSTIGYGFYLGGGNNNNISQLTVTSTERNEGIRLSNSNYNNLSSLKVSQNSNMGVYLYYSDFNNIFNSDLNSNYRGYPAAGILLGTSSDYNTITNNTFIDNGVGISVSSNRNLIYNNYFSNKINAEDGKINYWNTTKCYIPSGTCTNYPIGSKNIIGGDWIGGNFWSDYYGKDTDGDGIGDTDLPHNSSNKIVNAGDWMPLVVDSDVDGVNDLIDNCPDDYNPGQSDTDSDGLGDACDVCLNDVGNDADVDGICSSEGDCNDTNAAVYPGAEEVCDDFDNDCDGTINEGFATPADDLYINSDTLVCPTGFYNIEDSGSPGVMIINAPDIQLNCDGSVINGTGSGYGIFNPGHDNVTIKNCNVFNYDVGILLTSSENNTITGNTISDNNIGIVLNRTKRGKIHNNFFSNLQTNAWEIETIINKTFGGLDLDLVESMIQTDDGGYAIAGLTASYGAGEYDFWLVKTDADGNEQWNQTYGGTGSDYASSVVQTDDGGYVIVGATNSYGVGSDFWLVKTDADGNEEWNQTYGGASFDAANSVVQTDDGGYAIAGTTLSYGVGGDFWLVKTNASGTMEWNQTYGGTAYDYPLSVVQTDDGGYAIAGNTDSYGAGEYDFWLVKTDSAGNHLWNKTYGGTEYEEAWDLVETVDGGYTIAGRTWSFGAGEYDFWLVKTNASGTMEWNQTYGGTFTDVAFSVVQTEPDGGYAIAGTTFSYGASSDFWLVKTDSAGNHLWNKTYGGTGYDDANSVVQTDDGGYAIAGNTDSYGAGEYDVWLVKTDSLGRMKPLTSVWNTTKDCTQKNIIGGPCIGGNFWSDYFGNDTNGDGIGDTDLPYSLDDDIIFGDWLPLVVDTDVDGVNDNLDICLNVYNPNQSVNLTDESKCACDAQCSSGNCVNAVYAPWYDTYRGACCPLGQYWNVDHCEACLESDGDEVCELLDNCFNVFNPDQSDIDSDILGDVCDDCPGDPTNTCNTTESTSATINEIGGTVNTSSGNAEVDIPANALTTDTSISITGSNETPTADVSSFRIQTGAQVSSLIYSFSSEAEFSAPVTITIKYDDKGKDESIVDIYLFNTTSQQWEPQGTTCDTILNECSLTVDHFSDFIVGVFLDFDVDGIVDGIDNCPLVYNPDQNDTDRDGIGDACRDEICTVPSNLISWWPGDGNVDDIWYENNGTLMNGVNFTTGKVGLAFNFDGVDDYVEIPDDLSMNFWYNHDFSIDAWIWLNAFDRHDTPIVSKWNGVRGYYFYLHDGNLSLMLADDSGLPSYDYVSGPIPMQQWVHVAVTVDRDDPNGLKFYINGIQVLVLDPTNRPLSLVSNESLRIGTTRFGVHDLIENWWFFNGSIDEVEIFNRALSASEVRTIYNAGNAGKCQVDTDVDGVPDLIDNCWYVPNDQTDTDGSCSLIPMPYTEDPQCGDACLLADLNSDCSVNILDLIIVGNAFGSTPGDSNWNEVADLNGDNKINVLDLSIVGKNFGNSC